MKFVIRDDDLNYFSDRELVQKWYGDVFEQKIPVNFAVIPFVVPRHPVLDRYQNSPMDREYPIRDNQDLVSFVKNHPYMEVMLHGCNHEIPAGGFEYAQQSGLLEKTLRGKKELEDVFDRPVTVFVAPHDQFSSHGIFAMEQAGLNIIRGKGSKSIKTFFKMILHRLKFITMSIHQMPAYPHTVTIGKHQEAFGIRIEIERESLFKALHYAHQTGGNFILVNHIHDFSDEKKIVMLELIDEARKLGAKFCRSGELF